MPKILRSGAMLLTVAVLTCLVGFVHARVSGGPAEAARPWVYGLLVCVGAMALAATYMALVGASHPVLALFGWDGGPAVLPQNKRSPPLPHQPPADGTP